MCNCIDETNKALIEGDTNTVLDIPIMANMKTANLYSSPAVLIVTKKSNSQKRGGPIKLFASYCPFCGEKYPD